MSSTSVAKAASATVAKVTATIVGNAGAIFSTTFPHAPTATKAADASILDPSHPNPVKFDPSRLGVLSAGARSSELSPRASPFALPIASSRQSRAKELQGTSSNRANLPFYCQTDPIVLFIVQASLIVFLSRILAFGLGKLRQPKVISEVIAGILVGPTALGRIPHFTTSIFPAPSLPFLNLVATIGLVLFLFLVGLEVDFSVFRRNFRASASISLVGIAIPFALGAAISVGLYDKFVDESKVKFGTFLLFIGTANGITAFPVLARILTELNLLQDHVGVTVLAAGVGNDVVGWILLALAIALVNASSGIIVLYVILCAVGWILILWFVVRPALVWACRKTGANGDRGPGEGLVCAVVFLVLVSAWVTDRIGIHAICKFSRLLKAASSKTNCAIAIRPVGGFVVGLIVPTPIRASITEKIEDLVSVLFLPLYFALSGLKTDLGLLRDGSIWGWVICVCVVAFFGKFLSCGIVARFMGMNWRESGAVGSLMACKGLVELIVLNIGLSAGILNNQVFAIFVTMALVTTFATTPLTLVFYPLSYRLQRDSLNKGIPTISSDDLAPPSLGTFRPSSRYAVILQQFEHLPALFTFCKLVKAPLQFTKLSEKSEELPPAPQVTIDALRLVELTGHISAIVNASDSQETLVAADPLSQIFKTFARGNGINTTAALSIVSLEQYPSLVASHALEHSSDLVVVPWALKDQKDEAGVIAGFLPNPFEGIFRKNGVADTTSPQYAAFVRRVFAEASTDVGLFLDRGADSTTSISSGRTHLFFAFHGGADDRACLDFIVQLASRNPGITATIARIVPAPEATAEDLGTVKNSTSLSDDERPPLATLTVHAGAGAADTIYPTQHDLASETADAIALAVWFEPSATPRLPEIVDGLSRIEIVTVSTVQPLHMSVSRAEASAAAHDAPLVVVVGRGRRDAKTHTKELNDFLRSRIEDVKKSIANSSEVRRSLGDLAVAFVVAGVGSSVLVIQSKPPGSSKSRNA
ncbi:monovalent cation:H+ antiporter-2, CPA2 family, partial [Phenoliferia sp. Uapishka_3]